MTSARLSSTGTYCHASRIRQQFEHGVLTTKGPRAGEILSPGERLRKSAHQSIRRGWTRADLETEYLRLRARGAAVADAARSSVSVMLRSSSAGQAVC